MVERALTDSIADVCVQSRQQTFGSGTGKRLALADDDVYAIPEFEFASSPHRPSTQVIDGRFYISDCVGPHQVDVTSLGCGLASVFGKTAEVHRRMAQRYRGYARRREIDFVELTVERDRLTIKQRPQDTHDLDRSTIA